MFNQAKTLVVIGHPKHFSAISGTSVRSHSSYLSLALNWSEINQAKIITEKAPKNDWWLQCGRNYVQPCTSIHHEGNTRYREMACGSGVCGCVCIHMDSLARSLSLYHSLVRVKCIFVHTESTINGNVDTSSTFMLPGTSKKRTNNRFPQWITRKITPFFAKSAWN